MKHRYSEFSKLNEQLSKEFPITKDLLPGKRILGKSSSVFLEQVRVQVIN